MISLRFALSLLSSVFVSSSWTGSAMAATNSSQNRVPTKCPIPILSHNKDEPGYEKYTLTDISAKVREYYEYSFENCPYLCESVVNCEGYTTNNGRGSGCWILFSLNLSDTWTNYNTDLFFRLAGPVPAPRYTYYQEVGISRSFAKSVRELKLDPGSQTVEQCKNSCSLDNRCDGFAFESSRSLPCRLQYGYLTTVGPSSGSDSSTYIKGSMIDLPAIATYPPAITLNSPSYTNESRYDRAATSYKLIAVGKNSCEKQCTDQLDCVGYKFDSAQNACYLVQKFDDSQIMTRSSYIDTMIKNSRWMIPRYPNYHDLKPDTDIAGGTLCQSQNPNPFKADLGSCENKCAKNGDCVGFVFDTDAKMCSLLDEWGSEIAKAGIISGLFVYPVITENITEVNSSSGSCDLVSIPSVSGDNYAGYEKFLKTDFEAAEIVSIDIDYDKCASMCEKRHGCQGFTTDNGHRRGCWFSTDIATNTIRTNLNTDFFRRKSGPVPVPQYTYYQESGISRSDLSGAVSSTMAVPTASTLSQCQEACSEDNLCDGFEFNSTTTACTLEYEFSNSVDNKAGPSISTYIKGMMLNISPNVDYNSADVDVALSYTQEHAYDRPHQSFRKIAADKPTCAQTCTNEPDCIGYKIQYVGDSTFCYVVQSFADLTTLTSDISFDTFIKNSRWLVPKI